MSTRNDSILSTLLTAIGAVAASAVLGLNLADQALEQPAAPRAALQMVAEQAPADARAETATRL